MKTCVSKSLAVLPTARIFFCAKPSDDPAQNPRRRKNRRTGWSKQSGKEGDRGGPCPYHPKPFHSKAFLLRRPWTPPGPLAPSKGGSGLNRQRNRQSTAIAVWGVLLRPSPSYGEGRNRPIALKSDFPGSRILDRKPLPGARQTRFEPAAHPSPCPCHRGMTPGVLPVSGSGHAASGQAKSAKRLSGADLHGAGLSAAALRRRHDGHNSRATPGSIGTKRTAMSSLRVTVLSVR